MYFFRAIAFFLLVAVPAFSQTRHFKHYTVDNGLPSVKVYAIYQDKKSNLWIGGYAGISKLDGRRVANYSPNDGLADHIVNAITQDSLGTLYIGTAKGITTYNGVSFSPAITKEYIHSLITDKVGNVWIGTNHGIIIYDGITPKRITEKNGLISNQVKTIFFDKNKNAWIGTDKGVSKILLQSTHHENKSFDGVSILNGICTKPIVSIAEDENGNIWFASSEGLIKFDGLTAQKYTTSDGLWSNHVLALAKDHLSNSIWVGTSNGLNKVSITGSPSQTEVIIKSFPIAESINSNYVSQLIIDTEGNLWIGTSNGLYRFRDNAFISYNTIDQLTNPSIGPILRDFNGKLWIATTHYGFYKLEGGSFRKFSTAEGLLCDSTYSCIQDRDSNLLFGTRKGLTIYDGKKCKNILGRKGGLQGDSVCSLMQDKFGRIWMGGNNGFTIMQNNKLRKVNLKISNFVSPLLEDSRGNVWIGSYLGGVYLYNPKNYKGNVEEAIQNIGKKLQLREGTYLSIKEDNEGNIYLGSFNGVYVYSPKTNRVINLSEENGMSSNIVYVMGFDSAYRFLYIGTNQGLNKFYLKEYKKSGKIRFENYGTEEGFFGQESNLGGIWRDKDGTFWFGTISGLIHYNPSESQYNSTEVNTTLTKIQLFDKDTLLKNHSTLPYYLNNISFEYSGICLTNPEKVRYKVMLEGLDKSWSRPTNQTNAHYSSLPSGNYTFKITSCNNEGVWNKQPISFTFTITPPVWKTGWFIASSTLLIITASVLLLRYRANRIRKKEKEKLFYEIELAHNELKALRAQMDPHFIFNSLNSIQALIMTQDEDAALAYLNKFAKLMRMTLSNSEKSFISLREELDALRLYLELETLRWGNKFTYQISIDVEIDLEDYKIPTMLIQPYVENAIVHGVVRKETGMGDVEVRINLSDTHIICIVDDNGIGRQMAQLLQSKANTPKHESVGMKITAERLQAINRLHNSRLSANIIDKVDDHGNAQGTTVQIFIPI